MNSNDFDSKVEIPTKNPSVTSHKHEDGTGKRDL